MNQYRPRSSQADSAEASLCAIPGWPTPMSWCRAPAGFVSGPRMLKTVRIPISRRVGPTNRIAGWNAGAYMNPIPTSFTQRATAEGDNSIATPRPSKRSADPHFEVTERFPCLATRTPAPAMTNAAVVEMLNVPEPSPPVPQVSTTNPSPGPTSTCSAWRRMADANPAISSIVSPRIRSAVRNAPIWAGVTAPVMIWSMAAADCSASSVPPSTTVRIASLMSRSRTNRSSPTLAISRRDRQLSHWRPSSQEVGKEIIARRRQNRLRVELDAFHRQGAMSQAHHQAVGLGRDLELGRQCCSIDDQRVIPGGLKWIWKACKDAGAVVRDHRSLAMHEPWRASDPAAECRTNRLVAEADAENRHSAGEPPHKRNGDTGFAGRARSRGNHDAIEHRGQFLDVLDRDHIIAADQHVSPKLAQRLIEVEGE